METCRFCFTAIDLFFFIIYYFLRDHVRIMPLLKVFHYYPDLYQDDILKQKLNFRVQLKMENHPRDIFKAKLNLKSSEDCVLLGSVMLKVRKPFQIG